MKPFAECGFRELLKGEEQNFNQNPTNLSTFSWSLLQQSFHSFTTFPVLLVFLLLANVSLPLDYYHFSVNQIKLNDIERKGRRK